MPHMLKPRDGKDVADAVQWALANGQAFEVVGQGTKRAIGRPSQTGMTLDLSGLIGVSLYEPEELVLTAGAGTPMREIEALVDASGQQLAFEPMDYGPLLGGPPGRGTIGGVLAANLSGPRRIRAGAARDHFLGFSAVSGRGETFKSGGRVVKNVTGYDLCKLMAGSWGTLAALTAVTIKTLPRPETEITIVVTGLDATAAVRAMTAAMGTTCDVSGAAHLPAAAAARLPTGAGLAAGDAVTVFRLEGVAPSVAHRQAVLTAALRRFGRLGIVDAMASRELWRAIRDATPFAASGDAAVRPVWRIAVAPASGAALAAQIDGEVMLDGAGGLVWAMLEPSDDAGAAMVRRAAAACGGQATLIRAPVAVRATVDVFEPLGAGLAGLTRRVKQGFDPAGILNPGRMWAGV